MTALILAGGQSRRMGQDKTCLKIGGQSIIQRILAQVTLIFQEVIIVGSVSQQCRELLSSFHEPGLKIIPDIIPNKGPLGGLYSGLQASKSNWTFCCACDMPFLNKNLIAALKTQVEKDAVICRWEKRLQPLNAWYAKTCLPVIKKNLDKEQNRLLDILPLLRVKYLAEKFIKEYDPSGDSFFNVNTPEALIIAQQMVEKSK